MDNTINKDEFGALIEGMLARQESSLEQLYELTVTRVYSLAMLITRRSDLAEEVVSDTYWQAWQEVCKFDRAKGVTIAWLLMICRSRAIDCLRRQKDMEPMEMNHDEIRDDITPDPYEQLLRLEENTYLNGAFKKLTAMQRQLLVHAFFRGLTHQDIAAEMQLPLGTVKTAIRRAQASLRSALLLKQLSP